MTEQERKIYKRIFNQNRGYVVEVAKSTVYCKHRIRLARILLRKLYPDPSDSCNLNF